MAQAPFLAIAYKNRSFESIFSGSEINTFPYTLVKPEKQYVMAFKENQLDAVLSLIGLSRENIVGQIDTERPNVKILKFNVPYEYSINYDGSVNQTVQAVVDKVFIDVYKKFGGPNFSVHFTNNIHALSQKWTYADNNATHLFLAAIGHSGGYADVTHDVDLPPVKCMSNFLIPSYIAPEAIIRMNGEPIAMIKGDKIVLMLYVAAYLNTPTTDEQKRAQESAMVYLYKSLCAVFEYLKANPDLMKRLESLEAEYKFMEFLQKLISKRSETNVKRLREVRDNIPRVMTQLSDLVNEEDYLAKIVNAVNPDSEKDRLLKEITTIRKSQDVKDIVFEEDALIINMKHVMIPFHDGGDKILHCGELTVILPFDSKKELLVLRSDVSDKYPSAMRDTLKKIRQAHPNVFDAGRICYGNTAESFAQLRGLFDISSIFVMINNFLHVYNPKSPTIDPKVFPTTSVEEATKLYNSMYPDDQITADVITYTDQVMSSEDDD